ncbi:hypothetical protein SAMN05216198_1010 [Halopseudomonas litoralis]|uniref:Uncharacterized protein n=1 Tax=Halopseudomonas litoralis TaxID=797277 RepID=A0A1H1NU06_9GAMM|nr:hypothetical protein [Halopseudomonas litoralis]SDS02458.1 hypothetical protein SAMN05216198_1010 [Halopseudomonas litoralis]
MSIHSVHMTGIRASLSRLRRGGDNQQTISTLFGGALAWQEAARRCGFITTNEWSRLSDLALNAAEKARQELRHA